MKINPLWSKDLEEMTNYSYESLVKCSNIILSNYNNIKIGNEVLSVQQWFGLHIVSYEHVPLQEIKEHCKELSSTSLTAINDIEKIDWSEYSLTHSSMQNIRQNNSIGDNPNMKSHRDLQYISNTSKSSASKWKRSIYNGITNVSKLL